MYVTDFESITHELTNALHVNAKQWLHTNNLSTAKKQIL